MAYDQKTKVSPRKKMAMDSKTPKVKVLQAMKKGGAHKGGMKYNKGGMKKGC